ncbi:MAG: UDP-N-acetylmuramate dehydrogenase [Deltaproteobacteria bacterium]|nr:UDP-N-acetylmuramate dehydrogenase [Deltaproteobacteria bacterium]
MNESSFSLSNLSYYGTGGSCSYFYEPSSSKELQGSLQEIRDKKLPVYLLGGGSNSLLMDEPWEGAVISFRRMTLLEKIGDFLHCGAGVSNTFLSMFAYQHSLEGVAWMYRLPGQVGGTVRMNARCYGGEISQVVHEVHYVSLSGVCDVMKKIRGYPFLGYKDTLFMKAPHLLIAGVSFKLKSGDRATIAAKMDFCEKDRESKGQFLYPSCGCVFKNDYSTDVSVPSGLLLEIAGAKGLREGGAEVSGQHANFIYNKNKATSRDILQLSLRMRELVWQTFGVWLEYEMEILGKIPSDLLPRLTEKRFPILQKQNLSDARALFSKPHRNSEVQT